MNYLEVFLLTFDKLREVAECYPATKDLLRTRLRWMALRRTIVLLAKHELGIPPEDFLSSSRHELGYVRRDKAAAFMNRLTTPSCKPSSGERSASGEGRSVAYATGDPFPAELLAKKKPRPHRRVATFISAYRKGPTVVPESGAPARSDAPAAPEPIDRDT